MEIDIELWLIDSSDRRAQSGLRQFVVELREHQSSIWAVLRSTETTVETLEDALSHFLSPLLDCRDFLRGAQGVLRVGVFNEPNAAFYTFRFSPRILRLSCELNIALEFTSYPCDYWL